MPVQRRAQRGVGLAIHDGWGKDWRAMLVGTLPIVAGAVVPWLVWASLGRLSSGELAAVGLLTTAAYLRLIWLVGEHEHAARLRLGRRYQAPGPETALAVCVGLLVTLVAPGLSAVALVEAVGLPRAAGEVQSYDADALALSGATLDLMGLGAGGGQVVLGTDGTAHVLARSGGDLPLHLPWQPHAGGLCIVLDAILLDACLRLDRHSGRLRDGDRAVGRVMAVGPR